MSAPTATRPAASTVQGYNGPRDLDKQIEAAEVLAEAQRNVPPGYRGNRGDMYAVILDAIALDIPIGEALSELYYHDGTGKRGMSAILMRALIVRAGHQIHEVEVSDQAVTLELVRCDGQPGGRIRYTIGDAMNEEVANSDVFRRFTEDSLYARCTARLGRRFAADVLHGFAYLPDEVRAIARDNLERVDPKVQPREVAPEVVEFLTNLDEITSITDPEARTIAARDRWHAASKAKLTFEYAGQFDGRHMTVDQLLRGIAENAAPPVADASADAHAATSEVDSADFAGEGALPCGCEAETVVNTGIHREDCVEYVSGGAWAPLVTIRAAVLEGEPEPAATETTDPADTEEDVFGPPATAAACDCDPFDVLVDGHSCGRLQ